MRNNNQLFIQKRNLCTFTLSFFVFFMCLTATVYGQQSALTNTAKQSFTIKGTVLSELFNEPLPGASILLKNSMQGVETDSSGYFEMKNVPHGAIISCSFLGFEKKDIVITENNPFIKIYLKETAIQMVGAADTKASFKTKRTLWQRVTSLF